MTYRIETARDSLEHKAIIYKHRLNNGGMMSSLDYSRGDYTAIAYAPDGRPVGAATILRNSRPHRFRHLAMCYVKRHHRRSSVGRLLIESLLSVSAVDRGVTYAYMGRTRTSGRFWESLGIYWSEEIIDLCFSRQDFLDEYFAEKWSGTEVELNEKLKRELEYNAARLVSQRAKTAKLLGAKYDRLY